MHLEKRVLVSGGAGFLGSHLCEQLLARGQQVLCVDNFFTGTRRNIEHLLDHKRFELLRHDVTHPLFVEVDEIFNLACPASPIHYKKDLDHAHKVLDEAVAAAYGWPADISEKLRHKWLGELWVPFGKFPERVVSRRGGIAKGC